MYETVLTTFEAEADRVASEAVRARQAQELEAKKQKVSFHLPYT